jgi:hypothetical protein
LQVLTALLDDLPDLPVSQRVLHTAATYNDMQGLDIVRFLLERRPHLLLTEEIIAGRIRNRGKSVELLHFLFNTYPESVNLVTTATLKSTEITWYSQHVIPGLCVLVNHPRFDRSIIDVGVLALVAEKAYTNKVGDENALSVMLDAASVTQTSDMETIACAAFANRSGPDCMIHTLYDRVPRHQIPVTPKMLEAAAKVRERHTNFIVDLFDRTRQLGLPMRRATTHVEVPQKRRRGKRHSSISDM